MNNIELIKYAIELIDQRKVQYSFQLADKLITEKDINQSKADKIARNLMELFNDM